MTDDEVGAFLAQGRTLHLATINRDGTPHVVAMWYTLIDGRPAVWTYAKSQKVENLRRDPRVTVLVEDGDSYEVLRGVQLRGRAELHDDSGYVQRVGEAIFERYNDAPLDDGVRAAVARQSAKRVAVVVDPDRVASWDHRKLGGTY